MKKKLQVDFPFGVDRMSSNGLVDQLTESIRQAVEKGDLKVGDVLPGYRELSDRLGVSLRVPREAVGRLVQEGITAIREVVPYLARGEKAICGVRNLLSREHFDCALAMLYEDDYFALLRQFGIPYVASALRPFRYPGAAGLILNSLRTAARDFAVDCQRKKVRRVLQVSYIFDVLNLEEVFRSTGIAVETLRIPVKSWEADHAVLTQKRTLEILGKRLDRGDWPDVVFLCDDLVARAGLLAFYERNIRFPEDIGLVVWSNKGNDVLSFKRLTAMEMDVPGEAERLAEECLRFVRTGKFPKGLVFGPSYVHGASF